LYLTPNSLKEDEEKDHKLACKEKWSCITILLHSQSELF